SRTSAKFAALVAAFAISTAVIQLGGCASRHSRAAGHEDGEATQAKEAKGDERDLPVKEKIDQTYQLSPGAQTSISGINGSVDIETADTQTAEVHVIRSARDQETLDKNKTIVEHTPDRLVIRNENDKRGFWDLFKGGGEMRTRVTLKLPRRVKLDVSGVNGYVAVGEIDDRVAVSGVNGQLRVPQAAGSGSFSGINGKIEVTAKDLGQKGIDVSGVNGPIELRFASGVNADIDVSGLNGGFNDQGANVVMGEKHSEHNFTGKIGSGGAPINISGVNGSVTLAKAENARAVSASPSAS